MKIKTSRIGLQPRLFVLTGQGIKALSLSVGWLTGERFSAKVQHAIDLECF
jgi:hypothetical protein